MGVLGQKSPTASLYATQLAFLKDQSGAVYYYNSPSNNGAQHATVGHGHSLSCLKTSSWSSPQLAATQMALRPCHVDRDIWPLPLKEAKYCHSTTSWHAPQSGLVPRFLLALCRALIFPRRGRCPAGWLKIDVAALSDAQQGTYFPVSFAAPQIPFATDVTRGAAS